MERVRVFASAARSGSEGPPPPRVFLCRFCREGVRVVGVRYLPETCPACHASTWEDGGRCANPEECEAVRRPGVRGRSHCHACAYTIWSEVSVPVGASARITG